MPVTGRERDVAGRAGSAVSRHGVRARPTGRSGRGPLEARRPTSSVEARQRRRRSRRPARPGARRPPSAPPVRTLLTTRTCTPPTVADCAVVQHLDRAVAAVRDPEELDAARDQDRQAAQRGRRRSACGCSRRRRLRTRRAPGVAPCSGRQRSMRPSAPGRIDRRWVCATSASGSGPRSTSSTTSACRTGSSARSSTPIEEAAAPGARPGRRRGHPAADHAPVGHAGARGRRLATARATDRRLHRPAQIGGIGNGRGVCSRASPTRSGAARSCSTPPTRCCPDERRAGLEPDRPTAGVSCPSGSRGPRPRTRW